MDHDEDIGAVDAAWTPLSPASKLVKRQRALDVEEVKKWTEARKRRREAQEADEVSDAFAKLDIWAYSPSA